MSDFCMISATSARQPYSTQSSSREYSCKNSLTPSSTATAAPFSSSIACKTSGRDEGEERGRGERGRGREERRGEGRRREERGKRREERGKRSREIGKKGTEVKHRRRKGREGTRSG